MDKGDKQATEGEKKSQRECGGAPEWREGKERRMEMDQIEEQVIMTVEFE